MGAKSSKSGKGTKKYGRNESKCAAYKARGTREKNKARKEEKHNGSTP